MEYAIGNFIFNFFLFIIGFIIYIIVARWIFRVNRMIALQEKQIHLLTMIARQQGVPGDILDSALKDTVTPEWRKWLTGHEKTK